MFPAAMAWLLSGSASAASLDLMTIQAHRGAGPSDPGAEVAARELRSQGYASFTLESIQHHELSVGEGAALTVGPDHTVRVKVLKEVGNVVRVKVRLVRDNQIQVDSTLLLPVNSPIMLRVGSVADADVFAVVIRPPPADPSGPALAIPARSPQRPPQPTAPPTTVRPRNR